MFNKFYAKLTTIFTMICLVVMNFESSMNLTYGTMKMNANSFSMYDFSTLISESSLIFLSMVILVTSMVSVYSQMYMEHYNNKKFFFLMFMFFLSMSIMTTSSSFIILMIGWDGLGLSSIFLIMFYPNKMTHYNSLLTMIFNRMGDVILIYILCKSLNIFSKFYFLTSKYTSLLILFLILCSFTKSAQFPLSSWLPAAMSAPTPISAMVHSSTLVTAGIFIIQTMTMYIKIYSYLEILSMICFLTFVLGGLLSTLEKDFKKMVAFSTMSQISMIMLFSSLGWVFVSAAHMVYHAFFKTLLFVSAGIFFMKLYGKQLKNFINSKKNLMFLSSMFFFSIYSMSGMTFSSSFFSKDLIIENFCSADTTLIFLLLMLGSILTISYSSKLMNSNKTTMNSFKTFFFKDFYLKFIVSFILIILFWSNWTKFLLGVDYEPLVSMENLKIINIMFIIPMVMKSSEKTNSKFFLIWSSMISLMKIFTYSALGNLMKFKTLKEASFSDGFFFKLKNFEPKKYSNIFKMKMKTSIYKIVLLMVIFLKLI